MNNQLLCLFLNYTNLFRAIIIICTLTFANSAYTETVGCKIGDLSQGRWYLLHGRDLSYDHCPITGPPAPDSPWPTSWETAVAIAYTISGKIKLEVVASFSDGGWSNTPPSCKSYHHECVYGYAEAAAKYMYQGMLRYPLPPNTTLTLDGPLNCSSLFES